SFSLYALLRLGFTEEAEAFMSWLTDRFRGPDVQHPSGPLQIMYAIDGREDLREETLGHLEGYRGSAPVRVGNGAADQVQLDIYGDVLDAIWLYASHVGRLDGDTGKEVAEIADYVAEIWRQADSGIWEVRNDPRHFVQSKGMCWIALDRAARLAEHG